MDMNSVSSAQATAQQTGKPGAQGIKAMKNGLAGAPGLNFMDLIFARIMAGKDGGDFTLHAPDQNDGDQIFALSSEMTQNHNIDSHNIDIEDIIDANILDLENSALTQDQAAAIKNALEDIIRHATRALPAQAADTAHINAQPDMPDQKGWQLFLYHDKAALEAGQENDSAALADDAALLIATGLTPRALTELMTRLSESLQQQDTDTDITPQDPLLGLVKILPLPTKREAVFFTKNTPPTAQTQPPVSSASNPEPASAQLNKLMSGGTTESPDPAATGKKSGGFENILKMLEQSQSKAWGQQAANGGDNIKSTPNQNASNTAQNATAAAGGQDAATNKIPPGLSALAQNAQSALGSLLSGAAWDSIYPDGLDFSALPGKGPGGLTLNGPGALTSLVTQAQHAGQPHPATQMVASTIARVSASGESRNYTIRLDPPDLGRVEIRMDFNKDNNSLKTHLVVEKPETFMMLQRDAHALERILQNIGMDGEGSGLSFELAQDSDLFGGNDGRGGSNDSGGGKNGSAENEDDDSIIETTMDWHVDPETGMTRYDLLV